MPMQSRSGLRGIPWSSCDRCGYQYPLDKLVMQNGLLLCVVKCLDDTAMLTRDRRVAEFLATMGPDAENETAKKRSEPNIVIDGF